MKKLIKAISKYVKKQEATNLSCFGKYKGKDERFTCNEFIGCGDLACQLCKELSRLKQGRGRR